jgi:hypothetical protein
VAGGRCGAGRRDENFGGAHFERGQPSGYSLTTGPHRHRLFEHVLHYSSYMYLMYWFCGKVYLATETTSKQVLNAI